MDKTVPRSRYSNPHARPRTERTPYEPRSGSVRKLFYKVKKAQGTDITRTFCGLNDVRNIAPSITYAKEAGMISQCSLCITHSPIHTVEYYTNMALELIKLGADEICIKDMAGIGRPVSLGKIVANIKAAHPEIPVQYHSHAGPGFNMASILEVCTFVKHRAYSNKHRAK